MGGRQLGYGNFLIQNIRKVIFFFIKNPNLTKKIWRLGGEGVGVWLG